MPVLPTFNARAQTARADANTRTSETTSNGDETMSEFLKPDVQTGTWIEVRHTADQGTWIPDGILGDPENLTPADVLDYTDAMDLDDVESITVHRNAIGVRLSAPGYMDATDWTVHETVEDARRELEDLLDMGDGTDGEGRDVEERAKEEIPDDEERVRVEFHRRDDGEDWEREPVAVFPDLVEYPDGSVQSYVRVGQHGAASLSVVRGAGWTETDDADEETRKLADELERIGYRFVRTRIVWDEDTPRPREEVLDELENVRRELGTALDSHADALAQLQDADGATVDERTDRVDMLRERVGELEARAVELETELSGIRLEPGTLATFTPNATRDATGLDLTTRKGQRARIIRELGEGDADLAETGPMYRVEFDDGTRTDAFAEELDPDMESFVQDLAVLAFGETPAEAPAWTADVDADGFYTDLHGRRWDCPENERCPVCGQPDSCGDCSHARLSDAEVLELGGAIQ